MINVNRIAYVAAFFSLALSTACSSTDSTASGAGGAGGEGLGGAGGASAGAGGAAAGAAGAAAGTGGAGAGAGGAAAGGASAGAAGAAAGGASAGAGGSTAGAGGSTAGAGGSTGGAGGSGGGMSGTRAIRLANLVVGFKASPIDVCIRGAGGADWSTIQPVFKSQGDNGQFFSPTVSVWFDLTTTAADIEFRFVAADAADCGTPLTNKISDYTATIPDGEYHTLALAGDSGSGGSMKPIELHDIKHPTAAAGTATWTVFNGLVNGGTKGLDFGTYDSASKMFSAGITGVGYGKQIDMASSAGMATVGIARGDSKLVLAISSKEVTDAAGTLRSVFATGTNEFAAAGSNNLPWVITCDDANVKGQPAHPLVADCDYAQGPAGGVK